MKGAEVMEPVRLLLKNLEDSIIQIGYVGENNHIQVQIDCAEVFEKYPEAIVSMAVSNPLGQTYPAIIENEGDDVLWTVTSSDVSCEGDGKIQLTFINGEEIIKTATGKTRIKNSIVGNGPAPDPIVDFVTRADTVLAGIPDAIDSALEEAKESGEFKGDKGEDGYTPVKGVDYFDGQDGQNGQDGQDGADGFSPSVTVTDITGGHRVVITDAEGPHSFDVMDGQGGGTVDDELSDTSTNPVQNKVITEEVTSLRSAIAYQSGEVEIVYDGDGYVADSGDTVNISSHSSNTSWRHAVVECEPYDIFTVNVNGGGDARAWGFASEGGIMLSKAAASTDCRNTVITAPENTKYLILNDKKSGLTSKKSAFKYYPGYVTDLRSAMNKLIDNQYKKEKIQYTDNGYINTSGTYVTNIYAQTSSNNWRSATVMCNEGDTFFINAVANADGNKRPFAFVASNGEFISKCTTVDMCVNMIVIAPENAAYMIINDKKCGVDSYCVRREETIIKKNEENLDVALGFDVSKGNFQSADNPDSFVLLHFSDIHGSADNMKNICAVKEYLAEVLDDTICTGDFTNYYFTDPIGFMSRCTDGTILTCIGNHDVYIVNSSGYIANQPTEAELYAKFMQDYISKWGTVEHSNTNLYYYKDYADKKIRLIVLNLLYPSSEKTTEQNTWLATALAGAKSAGYGVVIAQHYYPVSGSKISCTFSAEVNFPTQMNNPQNYMYNGDALTTYQGTVQDFIDGGGNFVCWLSGHKHSDYIAYHPTYPDQLFIGVACACGNSRDSIMTSDSKRVEGTRSFDCMNVLAIDPADKKIKIVRIGCDRDFIGRHRGVLVLDYSTSPATVAYND